MKKQRTLIYHIGSPGDTLVAVPALWDVREAYPVCNWKRLLVVVAAYVLLRSNGVIRVRKGKLDAIGKTVSEKLAIGEERAQDANPCCPLSSSST